MRQIKLLVSLIISLSFYSHAQNWNEDLKALKEQFGNNISYSSDIVYNTYYDSSLVETSLAHTVYQRGSYYTTVNGIEVFVDDNKQVTIEHKQKVVVVSPVDKNVNQNISYDSILQQVTNVETVVMSNGQIRYKLYLTDEQIDWLEVQFDPKSKIIHSFTKHLRHLYEDEDGTNRSVTVNVKYTNFILNPQITSSLFSASKYIEYNPSSKTWNLKPNYTNYELVQLL